jgi:hypothetical protein
VLKSRLKNAANGAGEKNMSDVEWKDGDVAFIDGDVTFEVHTTILVVSDGAQINAADAPALEVEHVPAVNDGTQVNAADAPVLEVEHVLAISDAHSDNVTESIELSQESDLVISDGTQVNAADAPALEVEHALAIDDGAQINAGDYLTLIVPGAAINLTVSDGVNTNAADALTLTQIAGDAEARPAGGRLIPFQVALPVVPTVVEPQVHVLAVAPGVIENVIDEPRLTQHVALGAIVQLPVTIKAGSNLRLQQARRKRFEDEELIILLAA